MVCRFLRVLYEIIMELGKWELVRKSTVNG